MSDFSRRSFLKLSTSAVGASVLGMPIFARTREYLQDSNNAKIYTVFFNIAPSRDDTSLVPMTNEEIIRRLKKDCDGVDFVIRDTTKDAKLQSVLNEMRDLKKLDYDGVIIYGWPRDYDVLRSGLHTINISIVGDFMNMPYPIYHENKVLDAALDPWNFSGSPEVTSAMFEDLVAKIKLIKALKLMKGASILSVTDSQYVNVMYGDVLKYPPPGYNEIILDAINQAFGVKVKKIGTNEVVQDEEIKNLWYNDSKEANEIAKMWMRDAEKMINTLESEVVRSAKCYLAMKKLMKKYDSTAIAFHIRTLIKNPRPEDRVWPALGTSQFQKEGIIAKCQSHLNIVLTDMLARYAFGRPSMFGDFSVDTFNNTSIVQHCEGPWNPWGDDRRVPYIITDHRERRVRARSKPGVGAASCIIYPPNETVTIWQVDVLRKEILVHTGTTIPMLTVDSKYKDHFWEMI